MAQPTSLTRWNPALLRSAYSHATVLDLLSVTEISSFMIQALFIIIQLATTGKVEPPMQMRVAIRTAWLVKRNHLYNISSWYRR